MIYSFYLEFGVVQSLWKPWHVAGRGHDFAIELSAFKEKLMKEELTFTDAADPSKELKLILHARVLGNA